MDLAMQLGLALMALMGLHLPKAFTAFYALLALLAWRSRSAAAPDPWLRRGCLLLLLFGLSYSAISVHYGLWRLGGRDLLDLFSMLVLPAAGLWIGACAATQLSWRQMGWLWLAYGLGALLYTWAVLLHGRVLVPGGEWLDLLRHRRDSVIAVPWGTDPSMNVRSIEQNAALAAAWLVPGAWLLLRGLQRRLGLVLLVSGWAGLAAVLCFSGRLGWLVAALGAVPVLVALAVPRQWWLSALALGTGLLVALWPRLRSRLYDERFDRFAGFFPAAPSFPWGGNQLHFQAFDQQRQVLMQFDARQGELMHNVLFDIYVRVGWLPLVLLLLALLPLLLRALPNLAAALRQSGPQGGEQAGALIAAGVLVCLTVQWLFQPLIYGDGLLFYLGFVLLGYLAAKLPATSAASV